MLRYAITDRNLLNSGTTNRLEALVEQCVRLARSGVDFVQLREKDLPPLELAQLALRVLCAVRAVGGATKLLLNGHLDTAVLIGADGVHLRSTPGRTTPDTVRERFRDAGLPEPFVSVSCHGLEEVRRAREEGVSAVLFGPVFGKTVAGLEVVAGVGLEALRVACVEAGGMPVLALGGVTAERISECMAAGAAGVAAIRMFVDGNIPTEGG